MSPPANISNRATIYRDDSMSVIPDLKFDIHNSLAALVKLSAKVLATLHLEAMWILDESETGVFVGCLMRVESL
jgi:hypothetical protein